jgi:hypothetical protein
MASPAIRGKDMSIYATLYDLAVHRFGENNYHRIYVQGVPAHIDYAGPEWDWLPPPVPDPGDDPEYDEPLAVRAVFVVEHGTPKGTDRCGQEYHDWLVMLSSEEWSRIKFAELMDRIEAALAKRYSDPPVAVVHSPDGKITKIYSDDEPEGA